MAFYAEEDLWKCTKHPTKRRRSSGICPSCLRERLGSLCPDCGDVRPCSCSATTTSSSSASWEGSSENSRVSRVIRGEPTYRRSRSVGISFLRSRFSGSVKENLSNDQKNIPATDKPKTMSFLSIFKSKRKIKEEDIEDKENEEESKEIESENNSNGVEDYLFRSRIEDFEKMMIRSRSVSVSMSSARVGDEVGLSPSKKKGWKGWFRQKSSYYKVIQERSPLHRG